ncbi:coproporphyrinogen dehydrogenase HemZ [Bengtsoniella intestinalis]|uniref:coproporphyrinogen dehydrogenase HemZ n=1 Tax=Bengtsoniella intestinalis TaxID=3073143 RepID=UPI00391F623C
MKLEFQNHNEVYVVEQTLMALLPDQKPLYDPIDKAIDEDWAVIALAQTADMATVTVEMCYQGNRLATPVVWSAELSGSDYEKVGQRRRGISKGFFKAVQALTGIQPAWGSLTGVRPDKVAQKYLAQGLSQEDTITALETDYFVTPERARLATETGVWGRHAKADLQDARDIALYVGIPFCPTRCTYCSFVSASVERSFDMVPPYVDALIAEMKAGAALCKRQNLRPRSFYMGGGTPTTLNPEQLDAVLTCLEQSFDLTHCAEITVEAGRPDTITPEKLAVLKAHNVSRVSVNPQTMEANVLAGIGRRHSVADIVSAMEMVNAYDFPHVNMDLIAGLPDDTVEGFCRSLDACIGFGVDNITVHTLSIKKGSTLLETKANLPAPEAVAQMLAYANTQLRGADFAPYYLYRQKYMSGSFENVGWIQKDGACLYNIHIMSELCTIFSFGASGSTKLVGKPNARMERCFNHKFPAEYINHPEKWQQNHAMVEDFYAALD